MEVSRKHRLRCHFTTFVFYVSCRKNRNQGTRKVFFDTAYVNCSTITFFMQLARKLFRDFVQLPRKLCAGLAPSFAEARKHALKNILCHRRLPAALKTTSTTLCQAALKFTCCIGRPCCWSILLHRSCIFTGCTEFALLRNITS